LTSDSKGETLGFRSPRDEERVLPHDGVVVLTVEKPDHLSESTEITTQSFSSYIHRPPRFKTQLMLREIMVSKNWHWHDI
jgi:hypothetical protein